MTRFLFLVLYGLFMQRFCPANAAYRDFAVRDTVPPRYDTIPMKTHCLEEVVVRASGKKTNDVAGSQTIQLGKLPVISLNMAENLVFSSGLKVRQSGGGLGSEANMVLNSYSGKSIRGYVDRIPVEFMGYALGAAPALFFDEVEIYKGFAPDDISSDFLGGAINYTMINKTESYLKLSLETGTWKTNRVSARLKKTFKKIYAGFDLFGACAENDYAVSIPISHQKEADHILFNNQYRQSYAGAFIGLGDTRWADDIRFGFTCYDIRKSIPYNANMTMPYGKVESRKSGDCILDLRYKKRLGNIMLNQTLGYARISTQNIDTLRGSYQWDGSFLRNENVIGEAIYGGSWAKKNNRNFFSQTKIKAILNERNYLYFNLHLYSYYSKGRDDYAPKSSMDNKTDLLSYPARYSKIISSLGWGTYGSHARMKNTLSINLFVLKTEGHELDPLTSLLLPEVRKNTFRRFGLQNILSFKIDEHSKIKVGLNFTSRLPDLEEIYGDYSTILSNFSLKPENTSNITMGVERENNRFSISANLWYRDTRNIVQMEQVNNYWIYKNIGNAAGYGLDAACSYAPIPAIRFWGNGAFNNVRYKSLDAKYGNNLLNSRLRNTPFIQGNIGANIHVKRFSFAWLYSWVNSYYFTFIPPKYEKSGWEGLIGKTTYDEDPYSIIPTQNVHTLSISYNNLFVPGLSMDIHIKNLFDTKVFDNYRIQNAGRTFMVRITYHINRI